MSRSTASGSVSGGKYGRPASVASSSYSYRSASVLPAPVTQRVGCMTAAAKRYRYLRRLLKADQLDWEQAACTMLWLFVAPRRVFRSCVYRKQTKAQFARDDPAFVLLLCFWLGVTSLGFSLVLSLGVLDTVLFLVYTVAVDTLLCGCVAATVVWLYANRRLVKPGAVEDVEWGYAWDVHLSAFFPALLLLHFFMLFLYQGFLRHDWLPSLLAGNSLWLVACGYYVYITFLGYSVLPQLRNTRSLLYALPLLVALFVLSLLCRVNLCNVMMRFYARRVFSTTAH